MSAAPAIVALLKAQRLGPERVRAVAPTLDAAQLCVDADRHGLAGVVLGALRAAQVSLGPADAQLQRSAMAVAVASLKMKRLLLSAVDALAEQNIVPVVLKGWSLASRYWAEPATRPMSDVDLLLHPRDVERAVEVATALGLSPIVDAGHLDVMEEHSNRPFNGPAGLLELHHKLFAGLGGAEFDAEAVLARARPWTFEGRAVRVLALEDEVPYLAAHAANHLFLRLSWLVDLERLLTLEPALDLQRIAATARATGTAAALAATLIALDTCCGLPVPRALREGLELNPLRWEVDRLLFSAQSVASAQLAVSKGPAFAARALLADGVLPAARHLFEGGRRALVRGVRARLR